MSHSTKARVLVGPQARESAVEAVLDRLLEDLECLDGAPLGLWRTTLLWRLGDLCEVLTRESVEPGGWLTARRDAARRERTALLDRLSSQRVQVRGVEDVDRVSYELRRLVADVRHHLQRLRDLSYDEVECELGGSE